MARTLFFLTCLLFMVRDGLSSNHDDAKLNFMELASKYGHEPQEHYIQTEDGYILRMFRIPGKKGLPILLMHGVTDSADTWIMRGNASLAMALANKGHDVWAGNCRGNRYARSHVYHDPNANDGFWDFSFHEHGYYDLPAMIDTVLKETGAPKLNAIGHSQGNTIFYVLGSSRPEYNAKVNLLVALGPVSYLQNVQDPLSTLISLSPTLDTISKTLNVGEVFGETSAVNNALRTFCPKPIIGYYMCVMGGLFSLSGNDKDELEPEFVNIGMGHFPTSTSEKNLYHYAQVGDRRHFAPYNYDEVTNMKKYNSPTPPDYDLSAVTMPVALFVAQNDKIATLEDVAILAQHLPNVVNHFILPRRSMNHADFVWGRNMNDYLFPYIFNILKKHE